MPRASWFPAMFVGGPSCQTDWLFTSDLVNLKPPSKALSSALSVTGVNAFKGRWGRGLVGRWGEDARRTCVDWAWVLAQPRRPALCRGSQVHPCCEGTKSHSLSGELLAGGFSSELQVLSKGHFSGNCCQFSPILVSSTRFVPQSEACAEQTEA